MKLVINIMDGHGLSNKAHCENLPKEKVKVMLRMVAIHFTRITISRFKDDQQGGALHL